MKKSMLSRDEILKLDKKYVWHPYTPMKRYLEETDPIVAHRAEGLYIYDVDGTRYFDANGSWWVSILGHNHPRLMEALRRQSETLAHCSLANVTHEPAAVLAEKLIEFCGPGFSRVFYSDDGSTAVEVALRMAYQYWQLRGRPEKNRFVALSGAFHGETLAAASVSATQVFHKVLGPLLFDCIRLPSPAGPAGEQADDGWYEQAFAAAEKVLTERKGEVAGIILEPLVQGAAGMLMHPPEYLAKLRRLCDEIDALFIADEVFVGYGRTGRFLAHSHAGISADIVCLAKGFSGGVLPMAATVTSQRVFEAFLGGPSQTLWYGHSFTGNPLGAAVALEVLRVFEEQNLIGNMKEAAWALETGLDSLGRHPFVHNPRHHGLIGAFNLAPPGGKNRDADYLSDAGWRLSDELKKRGVFARPLGNVMYFVLPLNVRVCEIDELIGICEESLESAFGAM